MEIIKCSVPFWIRKKLGNRDHLIETFMHGNVSLNIFDNIPPLFFPGKLEVSINGKFKLIDEDFFKRGNIVLLIK